MGTLKNSSLQIGQRQSIFQSKLNVRASANSPDLSINAINVSQEQEFPAVVPGTEILPGSSGPTRPDLVPSEEARERLESLKATLLSKQEVPEEDAVPQFSSVQDVVDDAFHSASKQIEELASRFSSLQDSTSRDLSEIWKSSKAYAEQENGNLELFFQDQFREIEKAITGVQETIMQQVPPEFADNASRAIDILQTSAHTIARDPESYAIVALVGLGIPLVSIWRLLYSGYSGTYDPNKALDVIMSSDAILVDIRDDQVRMMDGVLVLKQSARGKGVVVPYPSIPSSVSNLVRDKEALIKEILASQIAAITKIGPKTKVIIMDQKGTIAKDIARATRSAGVQQVYFIQGGFQNCRKVGLLVENNTFYEDGPLALVADTAETLRDETSGILTNPSALTKISISVLGIGLFSTYFHDILKFIGVLGLEATLILRILQYNSAEEALDDIRDLKRKISSVLDMLPVYRNSSGSKAEGNN
eukprot:jgi/Picsp_1/484/NSC_00482-R1_protein